MFFDNFDSTYIRVKVLQWDQSEMFSDSKHNYKHQVTSMSPSLTLCAVFTQCSNKLCISSGFTSSEDVRLIIKRLLTT